MQHAMTVEDYRRVAGYIRALTNVDRNATQEQITPACDFLRQLQQQYFPNLSRGFRLAQAGAAATQAAITSDIYKNHEIALLLNVFVAWYMIEQFYYDIINVKSQISVASVRWNIAGFFLFLISVSMPGLFALQLRSTVENVPYPVRASAGTLGVAGVLCWSNNLFSRAPDYPDAIDISAVKGLDLEDCSAEKLLTVYKEIFGRVPGLKEVFTGVPHELVLQR